MSQETLNPEDYRQSPEPRRLTDAEITKFVKTMDGWDYSATTKMLRVRVSRNGIRYHVSIHIDSTLGIVTVADLIQLSINVVSDQAFGFGEINGRSGVRNALNDFLSGKSDKLDWKPSKG